MLAVIWSSLSDVKAIHLLFEGVVPSSDGMTNASHDDNAKWDKSDTHSILFVTVISMFKSFPSNHC